MTDLIGNRYSAAVAVAVDVTVRGPHGTVRATFVIRGVRGAVADDRHSP